MGEGGQGMGGRGLGLVTALTVVMAVAVPTAPAAPAPAAAPPPKAVSIAAGAEFTCALMTTGGVKCWGDNWSGQLGDGTWNDRGTPVPVWRLSSGVVVLATGSRYACVLVTNGKVKCWGWNTYGQLGYKGYWANTPVGVSHLPSGVTGIAAGDGHTCALMSWGGVKCWGDNYFGQLGDGTSQERHIPGNVSGLWSGAVAISAGGHHTCALMATGGVKCWGYNGQGQLGTGGTKSSRATPVPVKGLSSGVTAVSAGGYHTCALMESGGVTCWGRNDHGQLGDGTTRQSTTPVAVQGLSSGVMAVSAGYEHTCALLATGGVKCWGRNYYGQLGIGNLEEKHTPVGVLHLSSGVAAVSAGWFHTCALMVTGRAWCWGLNDSGQLGIGNKWSSFDPEKVIF